MCVTHIAKTGGTSLLHELSARNITFYGPEICAGDVFKTSKCHDKEGKSFFATFLRMPRHHVLSQYYQCAYSDFAVDPKHAPPLPVEMKPHPATQRSLVRSFSLWVDYFARDQNFGQLIHLNGCFKCYNPTNMQARTMVCGASTQKTYGKMQHSGGHVQSYPTREWNATLDRFDVVGITELFLESLCVILFKFSGVMERQCFCDTLTKDKSISRQAGKRPLQHNDRGGHKRARMLDLGELTLTTLAQIDNLTHTDELLYIEGLRRLLLQITQVEEELGRPILCPQDREYYSETGLLVSAAQNPSRPATQRNGKKKKFITETAGRIYSRFLISSPTNRCVFTGTQRHADFIDGHDRETRGAKKPCVCRRIT
uniref:Sulfotransferase domain-containing protein n=1 Tax=Octactis speculum TaxID=3111310 RepID=A0A7S2GV55_9STRA